MRTLIFILMLLAGCSPAHEPAPVLCEPFPGFAYVLTSGDIVLVRELNDGYSRQVEYSYWRTQPDGKSKWSSAYSISRKIFCHYIERQVELPGLEN